MRRKRKFGNRDGGAVGKGKKSDRKVLELTKSRITHNGSEALFFSLHPCRTLGKSFSRQALFFPQSLSREETAIWRGHLQSKISLGVGSSNASSVYVRPGKVREVAQVKRQGQRLCARPLRNVVTGRLTKATLLSSFRDLSFTICYGNF